VRPDANVLNHAENWAIQKVARLIEPSGFNLIDRGLGNEAAKLTTSR
jgi:hypothetical protein